MLFCASYLVYKSAVLGYLFARVCWDCVAHVLLRTNWNKQKQCKTRNLPIAITYYKVYIFAAKRSRNGLGFAVVLFYWTPNRIQRAAAFHQMYT